MGRSLAALAIALTTACGGLPDSRHGTLVLSEPELREAAYAALAFWSESTHGDVSIGISNRCESGESCARVSLVDGEPTEWGGGFHQRPGGDEPGWAQIQVARWTLEDPRLAALVLAHEIGHFLYLPDLQGAPEDLMHWQVGGCITAAALGRYNAQWETELAGGACLRDQDEVQSE